MGAFLALIGGAAAIVGAFAEWLRLTPDQANSISFSGWSLTDDAKIAAALGACGVVCAVVVLGGQLRRAARLLIALLGIGLVGLGAYDTYDIVKKLPDRLKAEGVTGFQITAPQLGLILVMAGGAVMILGALAMRPRKGAVETTPGPTSPAPYGTPREGGYAQSPPAAPPPDPGYQPAAYPQPGPVAPPTAPPPTAPPTVPTPPSAPSTASASHRSADGADASECSIDRAASHRSADGAGASECSADRAASECSAAVVSARRAPATDVTVAVTGVRHR